ncbi:MAG: hypothetical protein JWQ35_208 [Bacteriovoracaceae bacterium]|nr:hypothetical protein [Bacteriovoracaceae bacterium]
MGAVMKTILACLIISALIGTFNLKADAMIILKNEPIQAETDIPIWLKSLRKIAQTQIREFKEPKAGYTEVREVEGQPGIYLSLSYMQWDMNRIFNRATIYSEVEVGGKINQIIPLGSRRYQQMNKTHGGHDLNSETLKAVFDELNTHGNNKKLGFNLHEQEFYKDVLQPIRAKYKQFVIVSFSLQNMWPYQMVVSHEIIHGQYFTNPKFREIVHAFWHNDVTAEHREEIKKILGELNYDPKNEDLMKNEFAAYVLQSATEYSRLECMIPLYRLGLMSKLETAGIHPLQVK